MARLEESSDVKFGRETTILGISNWMSIDPGLG